MGHDCACGKIEWIVWICGGSGPLSQVATVLQSRSMRRDSARIRRRAVSDVDARRPLPTSGSAAGASAPEPTSSTPLVWRVILAGAASPSTFRADAGQLARWRVEWLFSIRSSGRPEWGSDHAWKLSTCDSYSSWTCHLWWYCRASTGRGWYFVRNVSPYGSTSVLRTLLVLRQ